MNFFEYLFCRLYWWNTKIVVYSGPISTTNSGSNGASIPDETEPLFLN